MVRQYCCRQFCLTPRWPRWRGWCTRGLAIGLMGWLAMSPGIALDRAAAQVVQYQIVGGAVLVPLTDVPGDAERGRRVVLDRNAGDCIVCHAMPLPDREFHGTIGPALDGVGSRYTAGELRLRLIDPKVLYPHTVMPAYYKITGLQRVLPPYQGQPILSAQQIEDVVAYLLTLQ